MKSFRYSLLAILLCVSGSAAQTELRGRLVESSTKARIYQGSVLVLGTELVGKANEKGEFAFSSGTAPAGDTLLIMASAYHFESKVLALSLRTLNPKSDDVRIQLERYIRQTFSEERPSLAISGYLVDENRKALHKVSIVAANVPEETFSERDGKFNFYVDQIRPIDQTELWFSKPGYLTKRVPIPSLRKQGYRVELDTAVVLERSRGRPARNLTLKFIDPDNHPVPDVDLWINNAPLGKTDLLGCYHITLGEATGDSIRIDYTYRLKTIGFNGPTSDSTLIRLKTIEDSVKINIDPFHHELLVKTFSYPKNPLPNVQVKVGETIATTDSSGRLRVKVATSQGEVVAQKEGFKEALENYDLKAREGSIEILLDSIQVAPPKKFAVSVFRSDEHHVPVSRAVVEFGSTMALTNDSGEVVFVDPKFPAKLLVQKEGFEDRRETFLDERSHYTVWLDPIPTILRVILIDSTQLTPVPKARVWCENGRKVAEDELGNKFIYNATPGEKVMIAAEGYRTKEILLPYVSGSLPIQLSSVPRAQESSTPRDTLAKPPSSADSGHLPKKFSSLAAFIGPAWWHFERSDSFASNPSENYNSRLIGVLLEKSFPIVIDTATRKGTAFRARVQVQGPSKEFTNLDVGCDFLVSPDPRLTINAGLLGAVYDLQVANVKYSWATPFFTLGFEIDLSDSLKSRRSRLPIALQYSYNTLFADHIQLANGRRKYSLPKDHEAPRERHEFSLVIKTKMGAFRVGYTLLKPYIRTEDALLKDLRSFYLAYGLEL